MFHLARDPDVKWVSGATDFVVDSNLRDRRWSHLASMEAVDELRQFVETARTFASERG